MLDAPPREREGVSWALALGWTLVVYATVPVARAVQEAVSASVGREAFLVVVFAAIVAAAGAVVRVARHRPPGARASAFWLVLVGGAFAVSTWQLRRAPEEALHFVEYGVLGVLLYRALLHRLRDAGIYLAAALLGACAGIGDEALQWATPDRVWDLRDVRLNGAAGALVQAGIALGLRPTLVGGPPSARSVRWICRSGAAAILLLGLSALVALEFGTLIDDPRAGRFRSRLSADELRAVDAARAGEAAAVLDRYPDREAYLRFLELYPPERDAFLHEARVHVFRRDRYLRNFRVHRDGDEGPDHATVAWHEQRILEEYFGETLRRSRYALPPEVRAELDAHRRRHARYESAVSQGLVTRVGPGGLAAALVLALGALALVDRTAGRDRD